MKHWAPLTALWPLVLACGSGTEQGPANGRLPEEAASQGSPGSVVPGFVDSPVVAFDSPNAGPAAASSDPNACILGASHPISTDEARDLGFDVDGDYRSLESELTGDVLVSGNAVSETKVHLLGRVDHVWRADRTPPAGVALDDAMPAGCPSVVGYQLTVQMFTEDSSIAGAFTTRASATPLGSARELTIHAQSDLRNFRGNLPVARDTARPFFATADISWSALPGSEVVFSFEPRISYRDSRASCVEPLCPPAVASEAARLSLGVTSAAELAPLSDLVESVADASVSSLSELVSAMGPYHPDVRLWVVAAAGEPSSVQIRARVDGEEIPLASLALTRDPRILTAEAVGGWLGLGEIGESVPVEFEVGNAAGLSKVQARIVIDGCVAEGTSTGCDGLGCVARSEAFVSPAVCSPN
jgi:hypothetical protein